MELQRNWVRPKEMDARNIDFKYYEHYDLFPREFTGEIFKHCKCIGASSQIMKFKTKSGEEKETEKLDLVFVIDNKYYFTHSIWGAKKQSDGTWGANPVALQDFLYLCEVQNQHSTELSVEHETDWAVQNLYPEIAGQSFTLIIAKTGERNYKERMYDVNRCVILSDHGLSAVEIQNGTTVPFEYKEITNKLHSAYCEFKGMQFTPVFDMTTAQPVAATPVPPAPQVAPVPPVAPVQSQASAPQVQPFNNDDIPFQS